ncbi:hypothetical protein D0469_09345 [Peribacillus saganii]|uniref:Uncharacterized protein n=1 Tax=Peribacillus saganii TaxID=2303992 RepID=A0A372LNV6_9BACI|nr:hypothetical protein [Peribacillus saganii]RFU69419.1 hypothetical protein D0469_09345 [Peribacillus saganii]
MYLKVTTGPGQYIRKPGLLTDTGLYIEKFGKKAALIGGNTSRKIIEKTLTTSFYLNKVSH